MAEGKDTTIQVRVDERTKQKLEEVSNASGISQSVIVRSLVEEFLEESSWTYEVRREADLADEGEIAAQVDEDLEGLDEL